MELLQLMGKTHFVLTTISLKGKSVKRATSLNL